MDTSMDAPYHVHFTGQVTVTHPWGILFRPYVIELAKAAHHGPSYGAKVIG